MTSPHRTARPVATRRAPAWTGLAVAVLALPVLVGCQGASSEDRLSILEEEPAEPAPEYVNALGILEPGSARFLGEADGTEYYVGEELATRGIVCLVPVSIEDPEAGGGVACSTESDNIIVTLKDVHGEVALVADTTDEATLDQLNEEGWTEVSRNLWSR